jgi:hypothetical protein
MGARIAAYSRFSRALFAEAESARTVAADASASETF